MGFEGSGFGERVCSMLWLASACKGNMQASFQTDIGVHTINPNP
jgi:hypothetical protein